MIEGVPGADRSRIAENPPFALAECDAFRIIYIHMDSARDVSPGIADLSGKPMDRNPLTIDSTVATLTGSQTLTNKTLTNPSVNNYTEGVVAIGNTGTSQTLSCPSWLYPLRINQRSLPLDLGSAGLSHHH